MTCLFLLNLLIISISKIQETLEDVIRGMSKQFKIFVWFEMLPVFLRMLALTIHPACLGLIIYLKMCITYSGFFFTGLTTLSIPPFPYAIKFSHDI